MKLRSYAGVVYLLPLALCHLLVSVACGYNPPVDEAGPLRVSVQGPSEIARLDELIPIVVELENRGEGELNGQLRVTVIDDWTVAPTESVRFAIPARGKSRATFEVRAGQGSYNAHYPVHAFATFESDGQKFTAHPVLVLEAKHTRESRAASPLPWRPLQLAKDSTLALWQVSTRRTVVQVFGEAPLILPVGQSGSEPRSRADVSLTAETLAGEARSVVVMHPPWSEGHVGTVAVEYPMRLPANERVKLTFANAMSLNGQSDGVTFRVRVLPLNDESVFGEAVFEKHVDAKAWTDAEVDLTPFAGQEIRLQLESHPGPNNNTGWDRCYWAEPMLVIGSPPQPSEFPPPTRDGSELIGAIRGGDATYTVRLWPGVRGLLDATIGLSGSESSMYLHGCQVTVLGSRLDQPGCPLQLTKVGHEKTGNGIQVRHTFKSASGSFDVVGWLDVQGDVLQIRFAIENALAPKPWFHPRIEDVAIGRWSEAVERIYAGAGNVLVRPQAFQLPFDGHRLSTSFVGYDFAGGFSLVEASDVPPTRLDVRPDRQHASLHVPDSQTRTLIPAGNVWEGVRRWRRTNGLQPAGGVRQVAGRFVFDVWGGNYASSAADLEKAFRYGLTDSMVVWHNWQRWGYDYRLPEIYPPNPRYGTTEELKSMIDMCRGAGVLFALHDNYIDYYPDAEGFSYREKIAFRQDGTPVRAWLNEGRGAQSYRYRSDCIDAILKENLLLIGKQLAPSAYFIDVWSSARPYDYWTAKGEYHSALETRDTWARLFAWIRDHLGEQAPQISESGHDQLIGWLDGAQTNHLRVGEPLPGRYRWSVWNWECADAERIPWFDAAHHDRFVLHGAGYESRYVAGLSAKLHGMYSDDYIVTEMLTGHPAMVSRPFNRDVVRKYWLTQDAARSLALRVLDDVTFVDNDVHRQHVRWSDDGDVWANRGNTDWQVNGVTLPQYGFLARISSEKGDVVAAIERRAGVIVERSESLGACYFNARSVSGHALPIQLKVKQLDYKGSRRFELQLAWETGVPIPPGWLPFLHFCDRAGEIVFQGVHQPRRGVENVEGEGRSSAVCVIPEKCQSGETYELCFGLYNRTSGARLTLVGPDVGDRRIRLGSVRLDGQAGEIRGVTWMPFEPKQDPAMQRQNSERRTIDFGMVATSSGCRLTLDGDQLMVTPLPSVSNERFDVAIRWSKLPWQLSTPTSVEAIDEAGSVLSHHPVQMHEDTVSITCDGGAFAYRLVK